jgi:hypothetical protein
MAITDVTLQKPDATVTLLLKSAHVGEGIKATSQISPLPALGTIAVDQGFRMRAFTVAGKITSSSKLGREGLTDAALNWWNNGDGRALLQWGTKSDNVTAYAFKVYILSTDIDWNNTEPGAGNNPILSFTLALQEVGVLGALTGGT